MCGDRQRTLLQTQKGETDLVYVRGDWYLLAVCDVEEPEPSDVEGVLGIDLGVTNIATDSDGTIHQGKALKTFGIGIFASETNCKRNEHRAAADVCES